MISNEDIVKKLWTAFDKQNFVEVKSLLGKNFVCLWPQSKELIRGADNFIALNENYPGKWSISCKRVVSYGKEAVSEVELTCDDKRFYATSFFEIEDYRIAKMTEYWCEPYDAPEWRTEWVEKTG